MSFSGSATPPPVPSGVPVAPVVIQQPLAADSASSSSPFHLHFAPVTSDYLLIYALYFLSCLVLIGFMISLVDYQSAVSGSVDQHKARTQLLVFGLLYLILLGAGFKFAYL